MKYVQKAVLWCLMGLLVLSNVLTFLPSTTFAADYETEKAEKIKEISPENYEKLLEAFSSLKFDDQFGELPEGEQIVIPVFKLNYEDLKVDLLDLLAQGYDYSDSDGPVSKAIYYGDVTLERVQDDIVIQQPDYDLGAIYVLAPIQQYAASNNSHVYTNSIYIPMLERSQYTEFMDLTIDAVYDDSFQYLSIYEGLGLPAYNHLLVDANGNEFTVHNRYDAVEPLDRTDGLADLIWDLLDVVPEHENVDGALDTSLAMDNPRNISREVIAPQTDVVVSFLNADYLPVNAEYEVYLNKLKPTKSQMYVTDLQKTPSIGVQYIGTFSSDETGVVTLPVTFTATNSLWVKLKNYENYPYANMGVAVKQEEPAVVIHSLSLNNPMENRFDLGSNDVYSHSRVATGTFNGLSNDSLHVANLPDESIPPVNAVDESAVHYSNDSPYVYVNTLVDEDYNVKSTMYMHFGKVPITFFEEYNVTSQDYFPVDATELGFGKTLEEALDNIENRPREFHDSYDYLEQTTPFEDYYKYVITPPENVWKKNAITFRAGLYLSGDIMLHPDDLYNSENTFAQVIFVMTPVPEPLYRYLGYPSGGDMQKALPHYADYAHHKIYALDNDTTKYEFYETGVIQYTPLGIPLSDEVVDSIDDLLTNVTNNYGGMSTQKVDKELRKYLDDYTAVYPYFKSVFWGKGLWIDLDANEDDLLANIEYKHQDTNELLASEEVYFSDVLGSDKHQHSCQEYFKDWYAPTTACTFVAQSLTGFKPITPTITYVEDYEDQLWDDIPLTITFYYTDGEDDLGSITAKYVDSDGVSLGSDVHNDIPLGAKYPLHAKVIPGYVLITPNSPKYVTASRTNPNPTVTFVYAKAPTIEYGSYTITYEDELGNVIGEKSKENVPYGTYTETAKAFTGYTVKDTDSYTITLDGTNPHQAYTFVYQAATIPPTIYGNVTVLHKDDQGNTLETYIREQMPLGTYAYTSNSYDGYTLIGEPTQSLTLTSATPTQELVFTYLKAAETPIEYGAYTVVHETTDGTRIETKIRENIAYGTYTEGANTYEGMELNGEATQSITIDETTPTTTITFTYTKTEETPPIITPTPDPTGSLIVNHESTDGDLLRQIKYPTLQLGLYTELAEIFEGYTLVSAESQSVTLTTTDPMATLTFLYEKDVEPTPPVIQPQPKGTLIILHETVDGAELALTVRADLPLGEYTEQAGTFEGYELISEPSKTVTLTESNPIATVTFKYAPPTLPEEEKGSVHVTYVTETGETLDNESLHFAYGTHKVTAKAFKGYDTVGTTTKTVTITAETPTHHVVFMYRETPQPKPPEEEKGSVHVTYVTESGETLDKDSLRFAYGTHTVKAKAIKGYDTVGTTTKKVTLTAENSIQHVVFMYRETPKPVPPIVTPTPVPPVVTPTPVPPVVTPTPVPPVVTPTPVQPPVAPKPEIENELLCTKDYQEELTIKSTDKGVITSPNKYFSIDRKNLGKGVFKVQVASKEGQYTVQIQKQHNGKWVAVNEFIHYVPLTFHSACFEDKVFLRVQSDKQSAVPHIYATDSITISLLQPESLTFFVKENPFTDVAGNDVISKLRNRQIIYGKTYTEFKPQDKLTRAHLAAIIARSLGLNKVQEVPYADTKGHWAEGYIAKLHAAEILLGDTTTAKMMPNQHVTAQQYYTMLNRLGKYVDGSGILYGDYFGTLSKQSTLTREQAMLILYQVLEDFDMAN